MSGDETIHKRDEDDEFEEGGDDELGQVPRVHPLYLEVISKAPPKFAHFCDTICINKEIILV